MEIAPPEARAVREALGLSIPQFAAVLGVHQSTVHRWETADEPVRVGGIPASVLAALRERAVHGQFDPGQAQQAGREISNALVIGGVLVALALLISFARGK